MTDLRALIAQLCDELDHYRRCLLDDRRLTHPLSDKARAALVETDGPAVSGDREPASVAKQCSGELSPAAEAVLDAVHDVIPDTSLVEVLAVAAALRAAAEIVAPVSYEDLYTDGRVLQYKKEDPIREKLLAIATELEAQ